MTSEPGRVRIVHLPCSLNWLTEPGLGLFCLLPANIRAVARQLPVRNRCSGRQLLAALLPDDVGGVPVWPVRIVLADPLLVLAVRRRRTPERGREFSRRGEGRVPVHASGQAYTPPASWNASLTSTPRLSRSLRAAPMSETIRYSPWAEPGAAAVTFLPKMTEQPEPGGVN